MAQLVCQNDIVVSHPYACHCLCALDDVAAKDYLKSGWFDKRILCLSLDDYERKVHQGNKDCTIDAAIGVGNYINNRTTVTRLLLLVNEFNRLIQFVEDMPYVPKTDLAQISKQLTVTICHPSTSRMTDCIAIIPL